jgi:hypothetical protein
VSIPSDFLGLFASEKEESPVLIESKDDPSFHGVPMQLAVAIQARGICHRKTFYGTCPDEGLKNERNEPKCRWSHESSEIQRFKEKAELDFLRLRWKDISEADKGGGLMQMFSQLKHKYPKYNIGEDQSASKRE